MPVTVESPRPRRATRLGPTHNSNRCRRGRPSEARRRRATMSHPPLGGWPSPHEYGQEKEQGGQHADDVDDDRPRGVADPHPVVQPGTLNVRYLSEYAHAQPLGRHDSQDGDRGKCQDAEPLNPHGCPKLSEPEAHRLPRHEQTPHSHHKKAHDQNPLRGADEGHHRCHWRQRLPGGVRPTASTTCPISSASSTASSTFTRTRNRPIQASVGIAAIRDIAVHNTHTMTPTKTASRTV